MADNDRVNNTLDDLPHESLSPDGLVRTHFTPGKASQDAGGMNWETNFRIPVGVISLESSGSVVMTRSRSHKVNRNIMDDQAIGAPTNNSDNAVTIDSDKEWGTSVDPVHTEKRTDTQDLAGRNRDVVEVTDGYDTIAS